MNNNKNNNNNFKIVMSLGIRCFTEIFLKKLGLKKFSSPFDALYLRNIENIIDLLENKIDYSMLIHSEDLSNNKIINTLNNNHGYRTIYKKFIDYEIKNEYHLYHSATFAHHNLKNIDTQQHFNRCFNRLDIIKNKKIKILFCLFLFPFYGKNGYSPYIEITDSDILKLHNYLIKNYNCKLLVISFTNNKFNILKNIDTLTHININNSSINFEDNKYILEKIFNKLNINKNDLLNYNDLVDI